MTPGSPDLGRVITISSSADTPAKPDEPLPAPSLFTPGRLVITQGIADLVDNDILDVTHYLKRHFAGDWGEIDYYDQSSNRHALTNGDRLLSRYTLDDDIEPELWIITEADRSATTVLLPSEY